MLGYWTNLDDDARALLCVIAERCKWDFPVLVDLFYRAHEQLPYSATFIKKITPFTTLLPTEGLNPLSCDDLVERVKSIRLEPPPIVTDEWLSDFATLSEQNPAHWSDDDILRLIPARTKMDLSLRRTRFRDVWEWFKKLKKEKVFWLRVRVLYLFDYISVCCILLASEMLCTDDFDWWEFMVRCGAFSGGVAHYGSVVKVINDAVKARADLAMPRKSVSELGTLTGYRNPPFPGFEVVAEAEDLANGGDPHGLSMSDLDPQFVQTAERELKFMPKQIPFVSFHDYVVSGDWLTSGASSVGKVLWEWGDVKGKFKARKNLVPDVVDLEAFWTEIKDARVQVNKTIIKAELGKIRLAVSSDLGMYLHMDWLSRYMTHGYKQWRASTIEESILDQTDRQAQMLDAVLGGWSLPFDYRGFDHQPTTDELICIVRAVCANAKSLIAGQFHAEYQFEVDLVCESFRHSTLSCIDSVGKSHTFSVLGGLMSGLRWTSLVGNAWNSVLTGMVYDLMAKLGCYAFRLRSWIRGDDSAVVTQSYCETLAFRLLYMTLGADGADGKFGIHRGASEFLRTWYDKDGLAGYAARSIPGLVQRKPWSSAPWDEESVMVSVYGAVALLLRRGVACVRGFWDAVKLGWSRRRHMSQDWLKIPAPRGVGAEPWDGRTWSSVPFKRVESSGLIIGTNGFTARAIFAKLGPRFGVTPDEVGRLAQMALADKVASDDIPAVSSEFRARVEPTVGYTFKRKPILLGDLDVVALGEAAVLAWGAEASRAGHSLLIDQTAPSYGRWFELKALWTDASLVARVRPGFRPLDYMRLYHPDFVFDVMRFERMGMCRGEALGWLFGELRTGVTNDLHPMLSSALTGLVVKVVSARLGMVKFGGVFSAYVNNVARMLEGYLKRSPLACRLYAW